MRNMIRFAATLLLATAGVAHAAAKPGEVLWSYRTGGAIWAPLVAHEGVLYVGSDDRRLHAVDLATRTPRWTFETEGLVRARPLVAGGRVYVASDDGRLYALDAESGREQWRYELGTAKTPRALPSAGTAEYDFMHSAPVLADGRLYIGSGDGRLHAIDAARGTPLWTFASGGAIRGDAAVADGRVYFGSWDHGVYALDARTGERVWRYDTRQIVQGTPVVADGKVVIGSRSAKLFALDAATGAEVWTHVYGDGSWVESSAIHAGDTLYIGSSDALKLSAFDTGSGRERWAFKTGGWAWATPVLDRDTLYIGALSAFPYYFEGVTLQAGFFAVDAATGREKWRFVPPAVEGFVTGGVAVAPAVHDGVVHVGAIDGVVYALSR